jgi:transposase InsO family protein
MFEAAEYQKYCDQQGLSALARKQIDLIRQSEPVRRVRSGIKNVSCRFASQKMKKVIQAESHSNELGAVVGWEYDTKTFEFYDQPSQLKLNYVDPTTQRARAHLSTPDFFVLQQDFVGWVECKTEEWLKNAVAEGSPIYSQDKDGTWRCLPGEAAAAELGLQFRVRSSAETNWVAVRNAVFLADYLQERTPQANDQQKAFIAKLLEQQAWLRLKELLEADAEALPADVIFSMISQGQLYVDLGADLLAEPERAFVFRDALAAKAYRINLSTSSEAIRPSIKRVKLKTGQSLIWDGVLWRILNVGESDVFLEDENRTFATLPCKTLAKLAHEGTITGLPEDNASHWGQVDEVIRAASPRDFEIALQRYYSLFPEHGNGQPVMGGERVHRKWRALFRKSAEATGFGFLGLLGKEHKRGNRNRKLSMDTIAIMNTVINEHHAKPGEKTVLSSYGEVRLACKEKLLTPPSEQAFRKEIKRRKTYELRVAREGLKAAYNDETFIWHLNRTSPRHGERPFELAHIDHTQLDLQFVSRRTGEYLAKAWLTAIIDAYTRQVLAWWISFEEPSYRSCMGAMRECLIAHGRLPKTIVVDKGSEFAGTYFETLLACFSIHKKTRPGSKPRYGSIMERWFGITNTSFIHNLTGNNQGLQKPRSLSKSHDPRDLAVWNLEDFNTAFQGYLDQVYHVAEHPALGMSPQRMMETSLARTGRRNHTLITYTPNIAALFLPSTLKGTAKLIPSRGLKINYLYYWAEEFRNAAFEHQDISVRFDPEDMSTAYAWLKGHWVRCRSELTAEFEGCSEKEILMASKELRGRFSKAGERRALTAELIAQYLRSITVTEKILGQRKKHQETQAVDDHPTQDTQDNPAVSIPPPSIHWTTQPTEELGEFQ